MPTRVARPAVHGRGWALRRVTSPWRGKVRFECDRQSVPAPLRALRGLAPVPVGLVDAVAVAVHRWLPVRPLQFHAVPLQAPLQARHKAGHKTGIDAHGARAHAVVQRLRVHCGYFDQSSGERRRHGPIESST